MLHSRSAAVALALILAGTAAGQKRDWLHWRGPEMSGLSREANLPDKFKPDTPGKNNLIWKAPYGGRCAPIVIDGRLCFIQGYGQGINEGERVVCLDAETGKLKWKYEFNVFHTDIVSNRLGWASMAGDKETGYVYAHGTQGFLHCLDKDGKPVWSRSLTEEYGRITGYGGRVGNPTVDGDLVIIGMVNASWGNQARGGNRFYAFDKKTGEVVWITTTPYRLRGTYYSNPVVAVINGQRLLISGGSDGYIHAMQVRTGKLIWSHQFASSIVNGSPIVDGDLVYCTHGKDNFGGEGPGAVVCLDASKLTPADAPAGPGQRDNVAMRPKVVWEYKRGKRFGLASAVLADGVLICPDDFATFYALDAKTGKLLWRYSYGRVARGSPLVGDGKLYVFDVNATFNILELNGKRKPELLHDVKFRAPAGQGFIETNGTPIAVNGKVYFMTADECYCIGTGGKRATPKYQSVGKEAPAGPPSQVQVVPAEVTLKPGQTQKFTVRLFDRNGVPVGAGDGSHQWALPKPQGKAPAPGLQAGLKADGPAAAVTVSAKKDDQEGYVRAAFVTNRAGKPIESPLARVRVAPQIPYEEDFESYPVGSGPGGWSNTQGKYVIKEVKGNKVLMKTNTRAVPPLARVLAFITTPDKKGYTISCDVRSDERNGKLPDIGVVNCRYRLILDGRTDDKQPVRQLRIGSWEAIPRIKYSINFDWQPDTWYRMKLQVVHKGGKAMIHGKVWPRDKREPAKWTIEFEDPKPNPSGAAALYGFVTNVIAGGAPGSEIYYDNVKIEPNK